jgi:hypothetical protein
MKKVLVLLGLWSAFASSCGDETKTFADKSPSAKKLTPKEEADLNATLTREFTAGRFANQVVKIDTGFGLVKQRFKLAVKGTETESFAQVDRQIFKDDFKQGHAGEWLDEAFDVKEAGLLDIIIVMDDSASMRDIQDDIASRLGFLLSKIEKTNWQIGVVTTSSSCLRSSLSHGVTILTKQHMQANSTTAYQIFSDLVRAGTFGDNAEHGILMAKGALEERCYKVEREKTGEFAGYVKITEGPQQMAWLRDRANKAIIFVTDEKNCGSWNPDDSPQHRDVCNGKPWDKAEYILDGLDQNTVAYGLLFLKGPNEYPEPNTLCSQDAAGGYETQYPYEYEKIIASTGGTQAHICVDDYSDVLQSISQRISDQIVAQYQLAFAPVASTLEVRLDGKPLGSSDFEVVQGSILRLIISVSDTAKQLTVKYRHGSQPVKQTFELSAAPDPSTLKVWVNGGSIAASAYDLDGANLKFKTMPVEKADIKTEYRENDGLIREFELSSDFLAHTLEVTVAGKQTTDFKVLPNSRKVQFAKPPADGVSIAVRYVRPQDAVTEYPISVETDKVEAFELVDSATGKPVESELVEDKIVLPVLEVKEGRELEARYDLLHTGEELNYQVPLAYEVYNDEVEIVADGKDPSLCRHDLEIGSELSFRCANDDVANIAITYTYIADYVNQFKMTGPFLRFKDWAVFVNGKPYSNYIREGDLITIPEKDLPKGSAVKIVCEPRKVQK